MRFFKPSLWLPALIVGAATIVAAADYLTTPFETVASHEHNMQHFRETLGENLRGPRIHRSGIQDALVAPIPRGQYPLSDAELMEELRNSANRRRLVILGRPFPGLNVRGFAAAFPVGEVNAHGDRTFGFISIVPEQGRMGGIRHVKVHVNGFARVRSAHDLDQILARAPDQAYAVESGTVLSTNELFNELRYLL